uniref:Cathepsin L1-like n=1 Tax=Stegastes partitus TaxID=144197 RepID=A0A3B5AW61_9TELE
MHVLLFLSFVVISRSSSALNEAWEEWSITHGKVYDNQTELAFRRAVWEKNVHLVLRHNREASAGKHSFTLGLNHLADMKIAGLRPSEDTWDLFESPCSPPILGVFPRQGLCGSCWAFSSLGALEGQMKKRTGSLVPLSPQNLVDCSTSDGNLGCRGGYISKAFSYIIRNRGVDSESFYPYEHKVIPPKRSLYNGKCRYSVSGKAAYCSDFHVLPRGDERTLQAAVASVGPVAVAVNAMLPSFHLYKGGLYNVPNCNPRLINHAVLVVGYDTDAGQDYWLVKNSWGTSWGEEGFIRIARNKNNLCGIASLAVYPTL